MKEKETVKGYKAFSPGFYCEHDCNRKQYYENSVAEDEGANSCCSKGVMHFCETPFDCLDYYPLITEGGKFTEFAPVEALDEVLIDGNKRATKKLRIGAKLDFRGFVKAGVDVLIESTKPGLIKAVAKNDNGGNYAKIGSSGDGARIGSSGDGAQIGSIGDGAQIGSSGNYAQIGSSGYGAKIGSSGNYAKIGSSGYGAKIGSSGNYAKIGSSGNYAQIGSSGDGAKIGSSGYCAKIDASGKDSIASAIGVNSIAKAALGCWIVLAEHDKWNGSYHPVKCVRAAQVDGTTIKPDTWYKLENGEFVEAQDEE